jgi:hypothetical protein
VVFRGRRTLDDGAPSDCRGYVSGLADRAGGLGWGVAGIKIGVTHDKDLGFGLCLVYVDLWRVDPDLEIIIV